MAFQLHAPYSPAGDQPKAIAALTDGLTRGLPLQTLLGVTGSGKTFTMANVIAQVQRPTLVIAHNKTLAAQLCQEFREFFPQNAVEYFVSYYDYYQPEAYLPRSDTYIEKEAQINEEIDRLRHAATQAVLSRRDVIIVASVSCIYALGSPDEYLQSVVHLVQGEPFDRAALLRHLVALQFTRTTADVTRGTFRARGDVLEIMPANEEVLIRVVGEEGRVAEILRLHPVTRATLDRPHDVWIFPAKHYVTSAPERARAVKEIERELQERLQEFEREGKVLEYERLSRRTRYDMELLRNVGFCNGVENYSRILDGRPAGSPPFTLLEYFPKDFLTIIDESHVTVPQIGGMYAGDQARKQTLIDHGFRLPSAKDNRPLMWDEVQERLGQTVCVSATPAVWELTNSAQVVEQIIRPTGLVDPETLVLPVIADGEYPGQIGDCIKRIHARIAQGERALVTTLTKKMAEDLAAYLREQGVKVAYLHSDVETLDRITILSDLRRGAYDVVVGVNLLREGLDLPEVSFIAILDADKEGFLRSTSSLIQTIGRAARNVHGLVVLYADQMTGSLNRALGETARRREIQLAYNEQHHITPRSIEKSIADIRAMLGDDGVNEEAARKVLSIEMVASPEELREVIAQKRQEMKSAAASLLFETAALLRDEIAVLEQELQSKKPRRKK